VRRGEKKQLRRKKRSRKRVIPRSVFRKNGYSQNLLISRFGLIQLARYGYCLNYTNYLLKPTLKNGKQKLAERLEKKFGIRGSAHNVFSLVFAPLNIPAKKSLGRDREWHFMKKMQRYRKYY
jgi:hypothetical protein